MSGFMADAVCNEKKYWKLKSLKYSKFVCVCVRVYTVSWKNCNLYSEFFLCA